MTQYVIVNRRAGKFTDEAKVASKASVAATLGMLSSAKVISDHDNQKDELARRVTIVEADPAQVASLRQTLPPDAIIEPLVRRHLHFHKRPMPLKHATALLPAAAAGTGSAFKVTVTAGGAPLGGIDVMIYLADSSGTPLQPTTVKTNANGVASLKAPPGYLVRAVEPIPYAGAWIMIADAPGNGVTIDCAPIAPAGANGGAWWHAAAGLNVADPKRGAGVKVGVIDTGCGPHAALQHVQLVGAFVDGKILPPAQGTDVAEHGSHTSGIVGARPAKAGDYAGMAPGCDLFHARVFKDEDSGATQADIVNAIDALSRGQGVDLINMSLGGGPATASELDTIQDALERGTLCICSAGNEAGPVEYPGAYAPCVSVSAMGRLGWAPVGTFSAGNVPQDPQLHGKDNQFLAAFSCFGANLTCTGPGVGIVSTVPNRGAYVDAYMEMDGTSMASPAVCGALAVILSKDAAYKALPRDVSRANRARALLVQHCRTIGLAHQYEGRGLPVV